MDKDSYGTPREVVDFAREVMGSIDCDPATHEEANDRYIKAPLYYTKEEDGLAPHSDWDGNVWLNPPYSRGPYGVKGFVSKLCELYECERIEQACLLVNSATATSWYQQAVRHASCMVFFPYRLQFWLPDGSENNRNEYQQTLFYLGHKARRCADLAAPKGWATAKPLFPLGLFVQRV